MAGERDVLLKGLRVRVKQIPERFDESTTWSVRSELFAIDAYLRVHPKVASEKARQALDRSLSVASRAHEFTVELRGFAKQKDRTEAASLLDLGSIGLLGFENILGADRVTLPSVVMSSLSEALTFLATRQLVAGSGEVLDALYRTHAAGLYEELWILATDHRKGLSANDVKEIQSGVDAFFGKLDLAPVQARIAVVHQFYALLLMLRTADLLEAFGG